MRHQLLNKLSVIHPFIFAISPILFLYAHNIAEVPATDLLLPGLIVVIGTVILLLSLRLTLKNREKAAIVTSLFLVLFFVYGHIRHLILSYWIDVTISVNLFLLPIWVLMFSLGVFFIIRARREFSTTTTFLNIVATTLIIISIVNISIYQVKTANLVENRDELEGSSRNLENADNLPDIYYIILDSYARSDALQEFWDYDNSEFTDYLIERGFYVATRSRSNYSSTCLSLASSLNMEHLDFLSSRGTGEDQTVPIKMIANSRVSQFLKSKGYRFIFVRSTDFGKNIQQFAEVKEYTGVFGLKVSSFTRSLIQTTALEPVAVYLGESYRKGILYVFDALPEIAVTKGPKFIFTHVTCPHAPFVFDSEGNPIRQRILLNRDPEAWDIRDHQEYLEQLIFITRKAETLVDELLSKSKVPPIIILQSDTGPERYIAKTRHELTDERFRQERVKIFNAYYFPEKGSDLLYESISPVNSFRVVFNLYFNGNYELLDDESYFGSLDEPTIVPPANNAD